jgi:hypothetical protein
MLATADRHLTDAENAEKAGNLSAEAQHNMAYDAVRQMADTALAAEGYRPVRRMHHVHSINSLRLTLRVKQDDIRALQASRQKRNTSTYDYSGRISDTEAKELVRTARTLRSDLDVWLQKNHASLVP